MKILLSKAYPHIIAVIGFFIISVIYFTPEVLEGKKLNQHDVLTYKGMSKEIQDYRDKFDKEPLWTNSMFGGMPAYLISTRYAANKIRIIQQILTFDNFRPVCFIFLYLLGFYIALLLFGVNPWLSMIGAIAYAFSSYFFIIIEAGHISKVLALGYMPPIIAGVYAAFRGKIITGSAVAGLFFALQLVVNHFQITYYTLLTILILVIFEIVRAVKQKEYSTFFKPIPVLLLFVVLAIASNFGNLWTTYEYGKYSIRGKTDLSTDKENRTSGLDKDYATQWSYGKWETLTLLIPNFQGGGTSDAKLGTNSKTYEFLKRIQGAGYARNAIKQLPLYWGSQPITSGPVYVGAIICFLFVLGMFLLKGQVKWWLFTITVVSILLAWGRNFNILTNFMLEYFPGYNKFRTVSMTLVMAEFAMPLLAILTVKELFKGKIEKPEFIRAMKYTLYIVGGIALIFTLIPGAFFDFSAPSDQQYISQGGTQFVDALRQDRETMMRMDSLRSLIFILLTAALLYYTFIKKIKTRNALIFLGLLILIDMWSVDKRYLNGDKFVTKKESKTPFTETTADKIILQDNSPDYRVLNLTVSPFNDASTSYFHKSIGGYHGAKMRRYQELIDYQIHPELNALITTLRSKPSMQQVDSTLAASGVLDMLNTKYIIINPDGAPIVNPNVYGDAWFVDTYELVKNADQEIAGVGNINPGKVAVIDKQFENDVIGLKIIPDSSAVIRLDSYEPNDLVYHTKARTEQLAVFSEIYYPKGWKVFVDGKEAPYFRADYVLRAMKIPAGEHTVEFKFKPKSYYLGEKISLASSLLLILLLIGTAVIEIRKSITEEPVK
jgi:hypothetical protein